MNRRLALAALLLFSVCLFAQNTEPDNSPRAKAVLKICSDWDDAYIKKDASAIDKLLSDDYVGIDEEGGVSTKAEEAQLIKSGTYVIHTVEHIEPPKVRFYGASAVVTTHARVKQTYHGETSTIDGRATTVCAETKDGWKVVSWHASKVKPE